MALLLALGNPGDRYGRTRHNVGWRVLDALVARWRARAFERTAEYRTWRAEPGGRGVVLMKPLTFMNASGLALDAWRARHRFDPGELLVVCDDVYLPSGHLRVRARGSSGGHRGLESLEAALGSRAFARLRLGVGGAPGGAALREHVLEEFDEAERAASEEWVALGAAAAECWLGEGVQAAMNRFNRRVRKEVSEP